MRWTTNQPVILCPPILHAVSGKLPTGIRESLNTGPQGITLICYDMNKPLAKGSEVNRNLAAGWVIVIIVAITF